MHGKTETVMIEGIHVDVSSEELRALVSQRREYHERKADEYTRQAVQVEQVFLKATGDPGRTRVENPADDIRRNIARHKDAARHLAFVAEHLAENETYRLGGADLRDIGIIEQERY